MGTVDGLRFGFDDSWHTPAEVISWSELEGFGRRRCLLHRARPVPPRALPARRGSRRIRGAWADDREHPGLLLSLAIVALVVIFGVRGIVGGFAFGGDILDASPGPRSSAAAGERTPGVVAYVLDGDTVQVNTDDGRDVRVRFLGISAPEVPHPGKSGECYGHPSTRHLKQHLPAGTPVKLVSDPTQDDVDTYDRWLRYVQASGRDIGAAQIRSGSVAARYSSTPVSRHSTYTQLEDQARDRSAGMWSACP